MAEFELEHEQFGMVFLDHDCVNRFVDASDFQYNVLTFWETAQRLFDMQFKGVIVIHSGNPVGAARMAAMLREMSDTVFVFPYGTFDVKYGG